jgi:ADP-ribose pyrophosphatase YjhB (NUDIX family)
VIIITEIYHLTLPDRSALFGIELKAGLKTLYIVRNIVSFLDQLARGESYPLSAKFSYDPELHCFAKENDAVLRALTDIARDHALLRETERYTVYASALKTDRMLIVPPHAWETLLPLLAQAPRITLIDGDAKYDGLKITDEPLPLRFEFIQANPECCRLRVHNLEPITVMEPYGMVFLDGKLHHLPGQQCKRLAELKKIFAESKEQDITLRSGQLEPFFETVVPGLRKLGQVAIAPSIAERITQEPLQAKLYLDRVKDRLLVGVEFQYGTFSFNPLENRRHQQDANRILIRDVQKEQRILMRIESSPFAKTESGYIMHDEEAEFEFLYTVVPQLEKLGNIYATTAVKLRLHKPDMLPKISVQVKAAERMNWLEFRLNMGWIPETEIRNLLQSLEEKRRYYRLPNGSLLPLDSAELQELSGFLQETGFPYAEITGSKLQLPLLRGLQLIDHPYQGLKLDKPVRQLLENLRNPDNLDFGPYRNRYDLPGGTVEPNESLADALHREFQEETGCNVEIIQNLGVRDFVVPHKLEHRGTSHIHHVAIFYEVKCLSGKRTDGSIAEDNDSIGAEWVKIGELTPENRSPLVMQAIVWINGEHPGIQVKRLDSWIEKE